jgi:FAD/FMN-containing dehydrogenase
MRDTHGTTAIEEAAVPEFRADFRGALLRPGEEGYDTARRVWNGMVDRRPALIARCTGVADVMSALRFGRAHELLIAMRGGGHNVAGNGTCDGGLVIDLSPMKGIRVDPAARTVWAQAGLTWGEFDRETAAFGLAVTGGHVSTTGIAGLTLGGGIGWLMRKYGLTSDNLLSADVVTADGRCLTASPTENADLFWGLRGGGGNFGIVTSFEYRLHPVETVLAGMVLHPAARAREVLRCYREFADTAPDELTTLAVFLTGPPAPFLPDSLHGAPLIAIAACYTGKLDEGERVLQPLRSFGPPAVDLLHPMPYRLFNTFLDAAAPPGLQNYWKSEYLNALSDEAIDTLIAYAGRAPSPMTLTAVLQLGGAVSRVGEEETPVSLRRVPYVVNLMSLWPDPGDAERNIQWTREFSAALQPLATGGVFVSFLGDEGQDRVRAAYAPASYERLVRLKNEYDPTNLFRLNQNIRPTG